MGNYESTRINIGVEIGPVSSDEVESTYAEAKEFVDKKVREEELKWRV